MCILLPRCNLCLGCPKVFEPSKLSYKPQVKPFPPFVEVPCHSMSFLSSNPPKIRPSNPSWKSGIRSCEAFAPLMQHTDSENSASAIVTSCHLVDFGGKHGQSSSAGKDTFSKPTPFMSKMLSTLNLFCLTQCPPKWMPL